MSGNAIFGQGHIFWKTSLANFTLRVDVLPKTDKNHYELKKIRPIKPHEGKPLYNVLTFRLIIFVDLNCSYLWVTNLSHLPRRQVGTTVVFLALGRGHNATVFGHKAGRHSFEIFFMDI